VEARSGIVLQLQSGEVSCLDQTKMARIFQISQAISGSMLISSAPGFRPVDELDQIEDCARPAPRRRRHRFGGCTVYWRPLRQQHWFSLPLLSFEIAVMCSLKQSM
jgi:hypothetical protein